MNTLCFLNDSICQARFLCIERCCVLKFENFKAATLDVTSKYTYLAIRHVHYYQSKNTKEERRKYTRQTSSCLKDSYTCKIIDKEVTQQLIM